MITPIIEQQKPFLVAGIAIRTSNKENMSGPGPIAHLWQRFLGENCMAQIPHKIDNALFVLYYDYENDRNGAYSFLIGARVSSGEQLPAGFVSVLVPAQQYAVFLSLPGDITQVSFATWQEIWRAEDEKTINRRYAVDYEIYDERAADPAHAQVAIHIGIKN